MYFLTMYLQCIFFIVIFKYMYSLKESMDHCKVQNAVTSDFLNKNGNLIGCCGLLLLTHPYSPGYATYILKPSLQTYTNAIEIFLLNHYTVSCSHVKMTQSSLVLISKCSFYSMCLDEKTMGNHASSSDCSLSF